MNTTTLASITRLNPVSRTLPVLLAMEDDAEDVGRLAPDDRLTCHVHGRWIHQCVASPVHVNPITRHRWCRSCATALTVSVDELSGAVTMSCPRCGHGESAASARLIVACQASLAAARAQAAAQVA
ncbi:hypothetical protein GCM10027598_81750 [Amycolatopsis oliviviridis]|uniref:Uncharacterized protein n=1 Tax=Amycolatopsis oliviviridis TaxID=1471590 RepID=A0ABQ3LBZ1_9PSEU|nr:hypothetical protein [Amycolatopsis oliviviridis]GHH06390.1 hypothetical protein GCM10017790_11640 [Amycolatopsis oliviviridis]